jgi:hypothetical protein
VVVFYIVGSNPTNRISLTMITNLLITKRHCSVRAGHLIENQAQLPGLIENPTQTVDLSTFYPVNASIALKKYMIRVVLFTRYFFSPKKPKQRHTLYLFPNYFNRPIYRAKYSIFAGVKSMQTRVGNYVEKLVAMYPG